MGRNLLKIKVFGLIRAVRKSLSHFLHTPSFDQPAMPAWFGVSPIARARRLSKVHKPDAFAAWPVASLYLGIAAAHLVWSPATLAQAPCNCIEGGSSVPCTVTTVGACSLTAAAGAAVSIAACGARGGDGGKEFKFAGGSQEKAGESGAAVLGQATVGASGSLAVSVGGRGQDGGNDENGYAEEGAVGGAGGPADGANGEDVVFAGIFGTRDGAGGGGGGSSSVGGFVSAAGGDGGDGGTGDFTFGIAAGGAGGGSSSGGAITAAQDCGNNGDGTVMVSYIVTSPPVATATAPTLAEGDAGNTAFNFVITLDKPSNHTIIMAASTPAGSNSAGNATAGVDYGIINNDIFSFSPGTLSQTVTVQVIGDGDVEPDEGFFLQLISPNITVTPSVVRATILNDDVLAGPTFSIADASVGEADGTASVSISRSGNTAAASSVELSDAGTGSASSVSDYVAFSTQILNFEAGETSKSVVIAITDDVLTESDETIDLVLANPSDATILDDSATLTIVDNDVAPLDFGDAPTAVQSGFANDYPTSLALNGARHIIAGPFLGATPPDNELDGQSAANAAGDDGSASDDEDALGTMTLVVGGRTRLRIPVANGGATLLGNAWMDVNRDGDWDDAGEQLANDLDASAGTFDFDLALGAGAATGAYYLRLRACTAASDCSSPIGLAADGEVEDHALTAVLPSLSISDVSQAEGTGGTSTYSFILSLSDDVAQDVSVNCSTQDVTASAAADYTARAETITIPGAGNVTSAVFNVSVFPDAIFEATETFKVNCSSPTGASILDGEGLASVINDDAPPPAPTPPPVATPSPSLLPSPPPSPEPTLLAPLTPSLPPAPAPTLTPSPTPSPTPEPPVLTPTPTPTLTPTPSPTPTALSLVLASRNSGPIVDMTVPPGSEFIPFASFGVRNPAAEKLVLQRLVLDIAALPARFSTIAQLELYQDANATREVEIGERRVSLRLGTSSDGRFTLEIKPAVEINAGETKRFVAVLNFN